LIYSSRAISRVRCTYC